VLHTLRKNACSKGTGSQPAEKLGFVVPYLFETVMGL
jgi:hypothetical protein